MPVDYTIDKEKRMVFINGYGMLSDQEVYANLDKFRNDPDFDSSFSQLVDCTGVTNAENLSTEAIYELARRDPFREGSRRAFVAPKKLLYGLFRMYQILTEEFADEIVVFKDLTEAHRYLKLDT